MLDLMKRGASVGFAMLLASGWVSAGVTVLDKPQLGMFATIQEAVDATSDNDVLLIAPGAYVGFTIDNKALSLIATGMVTVNGTSKVLNLAANRSVSLVGMALNAADQQWQKTNGLELINNAGNVRVQNCTAKGARYIYSYDNWIAGHGVVANASTKVIFTQCTLTGRDVGFNSGEQPSAGGDGANLINSAVAFYDCTLKGGRGSDETYPIGGKGGTACRVDNYGVFISGSTLTGGKGGGGDYIGCTGAGRGGDALELTNAQGQLLDVTLVAGLGNGFYSCYPGADGQQINSNGGVVNFLNGTRRKLTAPADWTDNSILPLVVSGSPGDTAWLLLGKHPAFLFVPSLNGVLAIPGPWFASKRLLGVIPASGVLNSSLPIGDVQGAGEGWLWTAQGLCEGSHARFLTGPLRILIRNT